MVRDGAQPNSTAYYLLAVAYYQQGDKRRALAPAEKAVELSEKPQESWLQLLLALRLQNEQYAEAVPSCASWWPAPDKKATGSSSPP